MASAQRAHTHPGRVPAEPEARGGPGGGGALAASLTLSRHVASVSLSERCWRCVRDPCPAP